MQMLLCFAVLVLQYFFFRGDSLHYIAIIDVFDGHAIALPILQIDVLLKKSVGTMFGRMGKGTCPINTLSIKFKPAYIRNRPKQN
jgi:hypothetical protein